MGEFLLGVAFCRVVGAQAATGQTVSAQRSDTLTLTLDDAVRRAVRYQPRLAAVRASVDEARAELGVARADQRQVLLPTLTLSALGQRLVQNQFAEIGRRSSAPDTGSSAPDLGPLLQVFAAPNTRTLAVGATIRPWDSGLSASRVAGARFMAQAAALELEQQVAAVELDAVSAYGDALIAGVAARLADSALMYAERTRRTVANALESGRAPAVDLRRAESAVAAQRAEQIAAQRNMRLADLRLRQLAGIDGDRPLALQDDMLAFEAAAQQSSPDQQRGSSRRAALESIARREQAAAEAVRAAWRAQLPKVELTFNHQRFAYPQQADRFGGPWFSNSTLVLQASMPLDLSGAPLAEAARARAVQRSLVAQRRDAEQRAALEALEQSLAEQTVLAEWEAAREAARTASEVHVVAVTKFEVGRGSLVEVEDARLAWLQREMALLRAAYQRALTTARTTRLSRLPLRP